MNPLGAFATGCVVVSIAHYIVSTIIGLRFAKHASSPPPPLPKIAPRVAVLKPLHGTNAELSGNLVNFLEVDYPKIEYLFGVSSYDDEAAPVVAGLKAQYPFRPTTLVLGEKTGCANQKVGKLIGMVERAPRVDVFLLSDADVSVERDHVKRVAAELYADDQVGLVTCLYRAKPHGELASRLDALFVNTDFVPLIMISKTIEPLRYSMGAAIAIKRKVLEAIGGFQPLRDVLADDYYLGKLVTDCGYCLSTPILYRSS
jgi:ceramide glucosyltransferase